MYFIFYRFQKKFYKLIFIRKEILKRYCGSNWIYKIIIINIILPILRIFAEEFIGNNNKYKTSNFLSILHEILCHFNNFFFPRLFLLRRRCAS